MEFNGSTKEIMKTRFIIFTVIFSLSLSPAMLEKCNSNNDPFIIKYIYFLTYQPQMKSHLCLFYSLTVANLKI